MKLIKVNIGSLKPGDSFKFLSGRKVFVLDDAYGSTLFYHSKKTNKSAKRANVNWEYDFVFKIET